MLRSGQTKTTDVVTTECSSVQADPLPAPSAADDPASALKSIAEQITKCRACKLGDGRNRAVPGEGNPNSRVMFVGEAPGFYEDQQGRPFVGAAG